MSCLEATFTLTPLSPFYSDPNNMAALYCYGADFWPSSPMDLSSQYASNRFFFDAAFAADPKIVNNARLQFRYHAACAAARASTGLEKDGATLTNEEGSRLRVQALTWLQADFAFWAREAASDRVENRASAERALRTMKQERAFECVRDPSELAKLPASESELWKTFWADVDTTFSLLSKPRP